MNVKLKLQRSLGKQLVIPKEALLFVYSLSCVNRGKPAANSDVSPDTTTLFPFRRWAKNSFTAIKK
jgi:hypothetical protein